MRVLLLGKFPPCQGGISAKTYWLYRSLWRLGFTFDIVTILPELYASRDNAPLPAGLRTRVLESPTGVPWFIPGGGLETERLISAALAMAKDQTPDVVECNYLAPFGIASLVVARSLGVPLIVRHAGSDLVKLLGWQQVCSALEHLLACANLVVSTREAVDRLRRFTEDIVVLSRYVPDPDWFGPSAGTPEEGMLLYAGKLNYYWRLKALDSLLAALRVQHTWRLLAVVGGTGREAFAAAVRESGLEGRVRFMDFVSPDQMPDLIAKATAVWAVEREGDVSDFSNIVWEAIACGRPCAVSPGTAGHADAALFRDSPLLTRVDPEDPLSIVSWLGRLQSVQGATSVDLREAHRSYVDGNAHIYETVCRGVGVGRSGQRDDQSCGEE